MNKESYITKIFASLLAFTMHRITDNRIASTEKSAIKLNDTNTCESQDEIIRYLHCSICGRTFRIGNFSDFVHRSGFTMHIDQKEAQAFVTGCSSEGCPMTFSASEQYLSIIELLSDHGFHQIYDVFGINLDHNFKPYLDNDPSIEILID